MTRTLHMYRARQFQRTRFGVNRPIPCRVPASARFQEPLSHQWACPLYPHGVAHRQPKTVPNDLIWSELAQWLQSSSISKIPEALITVSRSLYYTHGHAHVALMDKWPWRCTSRGWDSSNELDLEWIGPVVAELWARQTDGWRPFHSPPFFLGKGGGNKYDSTHIIQFSMFALVVLKYFTHSMKIRSMPWLLMP